MMERNIACEPEVNVTVDLNRPVARYRGNPLLTSARVNEAWNEPALQVVTVHNAGIARLGGETIMLFRSHLRSGVSVLGVARSENGIDGWRIDPHPALFPAGPEDLFSPGTDKHALIENESGGVEDPRITQIGETYYITYSAYHARIKNRVRVSLATTRDFRHFMRFGPMLDQDMRNVVIFPELLGQRYAALFRLNDVTEGDVGGVFREIRLGFASALCANDWDVLPRPIMRTPGGPCAFSDKIGPGAPPIKTSRGWLSIFHGVRTTMDGNPYVLGVALHDLHDPAQVMVSRVPILFPSRADCRVEESEYIHVPNVVFTCGALRREDGSIFLYYGGNDTVMNLGFTHEEVLIELCENYPWI
jgi:predicted GH43/DUF377 family glycosyl hydrolase